MDKAVALVNNYRGKLVRLHLTDGQIVMGKVTSMSYEPHGIGVGINYVDEQGNILKKPGLILEDKDIKEYAILN